MAKILLKQAKVPGITSEECKLVDTDRIIPKAEGGQYEEDNYRVIEPEAHMKRHGTWRKRQDELENLKAIVDDRRQVMNVCLKVGNQLLAYKRRTDSVTPETVEWLNNELARLRAELRQRDKALAAAVNEYAEYDRLAKAALGVKGVGPITVAHCAVYIDLAGRFPETTHDGKPHPRAGQEKAPHASSLWKYCGLDCASGERYEKGRASGGNKTLRTCLYTMAESQVKCRGPYREVYDSVKARLEKSEKLVKTRNTQGKIEIKPWKDTKPSHRHGAALRAIMKHFLADYWYVGRTLAGLEAGPLYAESVLRGGHRTVQPEARGWIY